MREFVCEACGGTFISNRPQEETEKEAETNFGIKNAGSDPEMGIVCSECYQNIIDWMLRTNPEKAS